MNDRPAAALTPAQPFPASYGPQLPPQLPPEWVPLFNAAYNSIPPGALGAILKQYWYALVPLLAPLLLSVYGSLKAMTDTPAALSEIRQQAETDRKVMVGLLEQSTIDRKTIVGLASQVDQLNDKLDRVLWLYEHENGGKLTPASQPPRTPP